MPIDLVGKLHRAVYVENCDPNFVEDLVLLLQRKCGAVEAWDAANDSRYVVVFQSVNSVSTALIFHQTSFSDPTKKLLIWGAQSAPPAGAGAQLALTGPAAESQSAREAERREARERRQAALRMLEGAEGAEGGAAMTEQERTATLRNLAVRQLQALIVLTQQELCNQEVKVAAAERALLSAKQLVAQTAEDKTAYDDALRKAKEDA